MKIININIKEDCLLKIVCKCPWYKSYLKEIDKLTYYLKAKDLHYKYFGWSFDENKNIVFTFRLLDADKDIKPYLESKGE